MKNINKIKNKAYDEIDHMPYLNIRWLSFKMICKSLFDRQINSIQKICKHKFFVLIYSYLCYKILLYFMRWRFAMKVSYDKLWKLLIDKKMKKYQLREQAHISSNSVAKLSKDEPVSMEILMKICSLFHCDRGDICEFRIENEE